MMEVLYTIGLLILLVGIVCLRFLILWNEFEREEKKDELRNREWFDEDHIRNTNYYED